MKNKIKDYTAFGNFSAALVLKNLPFVLFLGFLAVIYIANTHFSEKKIREIQALQKEMKELRWHYMSKKAELMYNSKQSEVSKSVSSLGLKETEGSLNKIVAEKK